MQLVNVLYATLVEFCTGKECSTMTGGTGVEYLWSDGQKKNAKAFRPNLQVV
jgi:hypothetical protein